ncbi:MAG: PAS domain S-box protein [Deltaproteobacteria bacterium]|nr:PAS domain S-box protein [Deltaproteobacteria bacterium]
MKSFLALHLRGSIWFTTIAVVMLIMLLALTVNHAREKAIVEQFSRQQTAIANGTAAGIEDLIVSIERSLTILSKLPGLHDKDSDGAVRSIKAVYDGLEGKVLFIVVIDREGMFHVGYPEAHIRNVAVKSFEDRFFFKQIQKTGKPVVRKPTVWDFSFPAPDNENILPILIGVPKISTEGKFDGVVFAELAMQTLADRYLKPVDEIPLSCSWILNEQGTFLLHSSRLCADRDILSLKLEPVGDAPQFNEVLRMGERGHGQYDMAKEGVAKRTIIAYAPLHVGNDRWMLTIMTPYDAVVALARTGFINIMLGAVALILVVVFAAMSVARSAARNLRIKEELNRLQEREDWQGKLLREKKTTEGIIEGSPVAMFVINKEHNIIYWNRACAELTGFRAEYMIGTANHYRPFYSEKRPLIADIIVDDDVNVLQKYYGSKQVGKSPTIDGAFEARDFFKNMGGKERHLFFMAAPIYDEKGEIAAAIETIQDITMEVEMSRSIEKHAETIQREKKTVEGIIEGSPVPTFVVGRDHCVILWNRACAELTGYDAADIIGTDRHYMPFYKEKRPVIADFIIDRNISGLEEYYGTKNIKKSETVEGAYEARDFFRYLGGKDRHLYFLAAPIYDEKGEIIAAIETLQDISKEVAMSRDLRDYAETLQNELGENIKLRKEREELYNYLQSIIESLPDKIFDLTADGIINYVSKDVRRDRGLMSKDIKGTHFTELVAPENLDYVLSKWEDGKKGIFRPYELEVTARDGSKRNLLITPRPVKGTNRYVLVQRDITDFKNLEEKYYESEKLAALGQLSAGIAHEVRNPLSSIKMSLQILEKRMNPAGNDLKRFKIAEKEVEHLEKLVNDVLIYAKPSAPVREPSDIRGILEHALAMVEKALTDKHIIVQKRFGSGIPPLMVDSAMLEQAFLNICHNAIDAMEEGGKLLVSAKTANDSGRPSVVVEIEDNGCGIDQEDMPSLFNPFFTRKKYGIGLGLAQVKKIIDLHHGMVEILSKKGEGTRFIVTLPVGEAHESSPSALPGEVPE